VTVFYEKIYVPFAQAVPRRLFHPINGSRDLSTDEDLSARLHRLRDGRKPCREGNAHDGNLENARERTKEDNAECGNSSWRMILCFAFWLCETYHKGKHGKQSYRFRKIFDTVFTRKIEYSREDPREQERQREKEYTYNT